MSKMHINVTKESSYAYLKSKQNSHLKVTKLTLYYTSQ